MTFGATILDADGLRLSVDEIAFFKDADPFGFILFARNIDSADQVRALCDDMRSAVGRDAMITIDQEGGRVQRLRPPLAREWAPPLDFVQHARENAAKAMYLRYRIIAHELRSLGIDSNGAPMVDVANDNTHAFLLDRSYGMDADAVGKIGRAVAQGLLDGGVLPVVKHMPGHGAATVDSHYELPRVAAEPAILHDRDFAPFQALNDLPLGMTGHLVFEAIDDAPSTLSTKVMKTIRDVIGFDGLIMTDDISMKALSGTPPQIARDALSAGCDVVLYCNAALSDRIAVADAAGQMTPEAQRRADAALTFRKTPDALDIAALDADLAALMGSAGNGG